MSLRSLAFGERNHGVRSASLKSAILDPPCIRAQLCPVGPVEPGRIGTCDSPGVDSEGRVVGVGAEARCSSITLFLENIDYI